MNTMAASAQPSEPFAFEKQIDPSTVKQNTQAIWPKYRRVLGEIREMGAALKVTPLVRHH